VAGLRARLLARGDRGRCWAQDVEPEGAAAPARGSGWPVCCRTASTEVCSDPPDLRARSRPCRRRAGPDSGRAPMRPALRATHAASCDVCARSRGQCGRCCARSTSRARTAIGAASRAAAVGRADLVARRGARAGRRRARPPRGPLVWGYGIAAASPSADRAGLTSCGRRWAPCALVSGAPSTARWRRRPTW
jgi:hypothetical protein